MENSQYRECDGVIVEGESIHSCQEFARKGVRMLYLSLIHRNLALSPEPWAMLHFNVGHRVKSILYLSSFSRGPGTHCGRVLTGDLQLSWLAGTVAWP